MALDTYANLQTSILAWLNRASDADAISRCPDWITLAENEFRMALNRLKVRQGETLNNSFAISSEYTALPTDYYGIRSIVLNTTPVQVLDYVTPTAADSWDVYAIPGRPKFYTVQSNQLRVYPSPDIAYTAKFTYYALPALSGANTTNWLLTAQPKLYLFAGMAEAAAYYGSIDKYAGLRAECDRMLSSINASDGADKQGGTGMRMRISTRTP